MLGSPMLSLAVTESEHLESEVNFKKKKNNFSANFKDSVMEKAAHIPTK